MNMDNEKKSVGEAGEREEQSTVGSACSTHTSTVFLFRDSEV